MSGIDELRRVAEEHGWTIGQAPYSEADTDIDFQAVKGTRRLAVYGDALGRVREAHTPRSRAPRRNSKAWCLKVLRGELPSSPNPKRSTR